MAKPKKGYRTIALPPLPLLKTMISHDQGGGDANGSHHHRPKKKKKNRTHLFITTSAFPKLARGGSMKGKRKQGKKIRVEGNAGTKITSSRSGLHPGSPQRGKVHSSGSKYERKKRKAALLGTQRLIRTKLMKKSKDGGRRHLGGGSIEWDHLLYLKNKNLAR